MPRKILVVDDNAMNRLVLKRTLCKDYEIIEAVNGKEALSTVRRHYETLSAVLLDIVMPEMDGYEVLSRIRDNLLFSRIPVIMVTGSEDEESRVKALSLGANDFILKPFNPEIVIHCLKNNIALREAADSLNAMQRDKLTGLYSREAFLERARKLILDREPGYYVMACFDIDKFKVINDQYGTQKGDEILRHAAAAFKEGFEPHGGICCRVAADNFAVLYPAAFQNSPEIEEIRRRSAHVDGLISPVTFSIGRYLIDDLSLPPAAMYDRAALAAKEIKGRYDAKIAFYNEEMRDKLIREQEIVMEMEDALKAHQFEVWFQPQYNHSTDAMIGAEALVRWRHPQRGLIPPGEFIPIFEESGFIYSLDKFVWEKVCYYLRKWMDEGHTPLPVSVNVSRYDVFQPDVVEVLCGLTRQYGLSEDLLRLEITESAFSVSSQHIVNIVKELIDFGFTVEIDDFGSGYSSLNTLKDVPAQIIKLDMKFLESNSNSDRGGNILESVVRMAKWLGMTVIAEGVETLEQADYLRSIGCIYNQGYLFARPMPAAQYEEFSRKIGKEERLLALETVENLDNNSFWDPKSMDTLIFNSYVGGACIFEYHLGKIELLRATEKYIQAIGSNGVSMEEILKLDLAAYLDQENQDRVAANVVESRSTKKEVADEYVFTGLPGCPQETYLRATLRVIATAGERCLVYCMNENITEQRVAEQEIKAAAAQMQTMMDDMPGGFVRWKALPDGRLTPFYFNTGFTKLVGMSKNQMMELYSGGIFAGVHPEDLSAVKAGIAKTLQDGLLHRARHRLICGDGSYLWLSVFGRSTQDASGNAFLNVYYTDATEQVKSEETQRALLDNLPGGAGLYAYENGKLNVVYLNKSYWELVGRKALDYSGILPMSAVHPDDLKVVNQELTSAIVQKRDLVCDIRLRHEAGGYCHVHLVGRIVPEESGSYLIYANFSPINRETMSYQQMLPVLLSATMDSTTDLSFAKDKDFRYLSASRAFVNMAGKEDESQVIGKTDYDLLPKELADKFRRDEEELFSSGKPIIDLKETLPSKHGAPRYINTSKYLLRDGAGQVVGLYGVSRDITKSVFQDSQLKLINDSIPGGIANYVCPEGDYSTEHIKLSYFNDGFCALFGFSKEEFEKRSFADPTDMVFREDHPLLVEQWIALMERHTPINCLYRAHVKGGGYKWISHRAVEADRQGGQVVITAILQDVTDQRELIEQLRISEEENNLAVQLGGNIICRFFLADRTLTLPTDVAAANSLPERITDVPYGPVRLGQISPECADAYIGFFESILHGSKAASAVFRQKYIGEWRWMEAKSSTIFSEDGNPVKAVISFYDVTERLEKETVYKKWQQSLEDKLPESYTLFRCNLNRNATYDTKEGSLITFDFDSMERDFNRRAKEYIQQCVFAEDRERYASFINSDSLLAGYYRGKRSGTLEYRELLPEGYYRWLRLTVELVEQANSCDVEAYLLYEDIDEAKTAELKTRQRAESDSLTGLLNRKTFEERFEQLMGQREKGAVSALFVIDLDGFKLVNDHFGHAVGDETLIEIGQKLRETFREQDLVCRMGGDEFMIYMSGDSRIEAIKEKASLICALLHKSFSLEVQLSASVGVSLCPENGENFETLYRKADAALYHVKETGKDGYVLFAENMREQELPEEGKTAHNKVEARAHYKAPKRRMLIVEDNEINRDYLKSLFEDEFIIDTAAEGTAALVRLRRYGSGISIVLLDLMMPGMNGFALLKKMRESLTMQAIPVIVVSGMNEREACLEAIREGASDYITKPVDAEILRLRVESALGKADNEQLRAKNRYLALQNEEAKRLAEARRHSEELSVALHAAERADFAKSQFLSSMSHEIRTPLNAVIGYNTIARSEMSEARTDEDRRQANMKVMDCLTKSEVASRHLLTIINDVLDMSAIESGKMKVDYSPFDFRSLITSLTVMFFSQARAKGVNFEVLFDKPTEEWFVGDQLRINQILTNLLSNAVKFTPEGGSVTLTITEGTIDDKSTGFCFIVSDTGIGMTQEYLEHIWTPFEQAEASISRRFGGTGLGLSITKNLVDLMGGQIAVESESGFGSKFTVSLTLARTEQPQKTASYDFSSVNALVVDDDASTCDYIKLLFDRCDARCMAFTSGRRAVDAFADAKERGKPFNVCLVDWRMPQMDGFATISEIRRIAAKELPIVVVTAYDFAEVSEQAEKLGINRFISKPLFQSSLFDLLANISGKQLPSTEDDSQKYKHLEDMRVLLAEDNNMNMEVARHILHSVGIAVDSAWNGQEAVDIFEASKEGAYNVVLMDIHMPAVDGYQATRMIRASGHPDGQKIPIIAMTADVFAEDIAEAHSVGMNGHIAKPIDVDALYQLLSSYMEGREE